MVHRHSNFFQSGCNLCITNCVSRIAIFLFPSKRGDILILYTRRYRASTAQWGKEVSLDYNNSFTKRLLVRLQRTAAVNNNAGSTGRRVIDEKRNGGEKWVARTRTTFPFNPRRPGCFTSLRAHFTIFERFLALIIKRVDAKHASARGRLLQHSNSIANLRFIVSQVCSKWVRVYRVYRK